MKKICMIFLLSIFMNVHVVYAETAVGDKAYEAYEKSTYYYKKKDYKNELKWLKISFEKEETKEIAFNIGLSYKNLKDYDNAIKWYKKAFKMGHVDGGVNLGLLYQQINKDYSTAIKWYKQSIEKGDISARKNLGLLYHDQNNSLNSAVYMIGMIGHPYTKERVLGLLRDDWKIDEKTIKEAYKLQLKLLPNPYRDSEFEEDTKKKKSGRR